MSKRSMLLIFLFGAAAFAFVAAQIDEPVFESYDIGPYSAGGSGGSDGSSADEATDGADSKKASVEKPKRERKEKSVRNKRTGQSFSSAFSGPQKTCPVCSSVRLKSGRYVDYSGGRIHVCSMACIDRVRRNPTAFADILVKRGEQLTTP